MDDSAIMWDKITQSYNDKKNFHEKKATCIMQSFCILLKFLLITTAIIDSCSYLLLSDKVLGKTKSFITIL